MTTYRLILNTIEKLRKKKKVDVHDFVEGIMSDRNYRRMLNQEQSINLEAIMLLLQRLNVTTHNLFNYMANDYRTTYPNEFYLSDALENKDEAQIQELLKVVDENHFQTTMGFYVLPIQLLRYRYEKGLMKKEVFLEKALTYYDYIHHEYYMIGHEEVYALLTVLPYETSKHQIMLINMLIKVILNEVILVSYALSTDRMKIIKNIVDVVQKVDDFKTHFDEKLQPILKIGLEEAYDSLDRRAALDMFEAVMAYASDEQSELYQKAHYLKLSILYNMNRSLLKDQDIEQLETYEQMPEMKDFYWTKGCFDL